MRYLDPGSPGGLRRGGVSGSALLFVGVALGACGGTVVDRSAGGSGSATGGNATGGVATGGNAMGGIAPGGSATGGRSVGGASPGGAGGGGGNPLTCPPGYTACASECADLRTSTHHCGTCATDCGSPSLCTDGVCGSFCPAGTVYCQSFRQCIDTQSNVFACGACDTPCLKGEACVGGVCLPGTCADPKQTYCKTTDLCSDLSSDVQHCGACEHSCVPSPAYALNAVTCTNGTCACAPDASSCGTACARDFWYCPPAGSTAAPLDYCMQSARNAYERCACKACLPQITACAGSDACINALDCSLSQICSSCVEPFSSCTGVSGEPPGPLATDLVVCMNRACATP